MRASGELARFRYRAATDTGAMIEGEVSAATRDHAVDELRRQSLVPVIVTLASPGTAAGARWGGLVGLDRGRATDLALWTRTLATLLEADAPLDRALMAAAASLRSPAVIAGAAAVRSRVVAGSTLADAMRAAPEVFSPLQAAMIEAGEASGTLDRACALLADVLDEEDERRSQIQAALLYPALMGAVSMLGVVVLLLFVVPRFSALLADAGGQLPWSTRLLVALGSFVAGWWWAIGLVLASVITVGRAWLASDDGRARWHRARLTWPVIGPLERSMASARFTRGLGVLLDGGLPLLGAWRVAQRSVSNRAIATDLEGAVSRVARGDRIDAALKGILSPLAVQLLAVGEEGGQLGSLALRAASALDRDVRHALRTATALLEPALIIVFGGIVGFVALAMLQALYAVNSGYAS
jgi:type II secretory pathway component PulF